MIKHANVKRLQYGTYLVKDNYSDNIFLYKEISTERSIDKLWSEFSEELSVPVYVDHVPENVEMPYAILTMLHSFPGGEKLFSITGWKEVDK